MSPETPKVWVVATLLAVALAVSADAQGGRQAASSDPLQRHYSAAGAFLSHGDQERAAFEYRAFLAEALHRAANANARIGEAPRATELFTQALEFDDRDSTTLDDFASLRFDHDQLPEAETLLSSALALEPNDIRAHFILGRVLFNEEKYQAAQSHLETGLAF